MDLSSNVILNIFSIAILGIIFVQAIKSTEKNLLQQKFFILTLIVTFLMLAMDIFSRFDGKPGTFYAFINQLGNFIIFLLSPVLPAFWLMYVYSQLRSLQQKIKRWLYLLPAVIVLNTIMLVLSQFYGWFYTIGPDNIYHRGPLYWFPVSVTAILAVSAYILVLVNRNNINNKHFISLVLFPVPPLVCIVLQVSFYGISFILNGAVLSLLFAFISIQNERLNTDFLTGAYNRKGLDAYIRQKINACAENKTFSIILLDLDNFKMINDTFGHNKGDQVLVNSAKILKGCLKSNDFVARFGGDEFCIVLNISRRDELEAAVSKIHEHIENYNQNSFEPFRLSASMGYAVYDYHSHMNAEEFHAQVDALMYENKRNNKERLQQNSRRACQGL